MPSNTINICDPQWGAVIETSRNVLPATVDIRADSGVIELREDFQTPNIGVVILGAGGPHGLATPPAPTYEIVGSPGAKRIEYRIVAITEQMGYTAASETLVVADAPNTIDASNYVRIIPDEVPNAYQYLIYGKPESRDQFEFFGAIIARPWGVPGLRDSDTEGRRQKYSRLVHFDDKPSVDVFREVYHRDGGEPLDPRFVPPYVPMRDLAVGDSPCIAPEAAGNNYLRTRIVEDTDPVDPAGPSILQLRDLPGSDISNTLMFHDNSIVFQDAIEDPAVQRIYIPVGRYPMFGNIRVGWNQEAGAIQGERKIHLEGEAHFIDGRANSTFVFNPGFGIESWASYSMFENIRFEGIGKYQHSLPAGGLFVTRITYLQHDEDRNSRPEVVHGCMALALTRSRWSNCTFAGVAGTGHAIWPYINANFTQVDFCFSIKNTGHGFYAGGTADSQMCTWTRCLVRGNGGWGIYDSGFLGNLMMSCQADGNWRGQYLVDDTGARSTVIGCYSEGNHPPSKFGDNAVVLGGNHGARMVDDTRGLRLLNHNHVSPFSIQRRIHEGRKPYNLDRDVHHSIELGDKVGTRKNQLKLQKFYSQTEPIEHLIHWFRQDPREGGVDPFVNKPVQRIRFVAKETNGRPGMEWCQGEVRGQGAIAFPEGFLLRAGGREWSTERRITGWNQYNPIARQTYDQGDLIIDLSGANYFFRPKERFGLGQPWQKGAGYSIGDTAIPTEPNGNVYVVVAYYDGSTKTYFKPPNYSETEPHADTGNFGYSSSHHEPDWNKEGDIEDYQLVWREWGPAWNGGAAKNLLDTLGRRTANLNIPVGRSESDEFEIGANSTERFFVRIDGAEPGDAVVATPGGDLPLGIVWNAIVHERFRVSLRLTNVSSEPQRINVMPWRIDCWKH